MTVRTRCFVIVDPYVNSPEIEAYNLINRICGEMIASKKSNLECVQIYNTCFATQTFASFLSNVDPVAVLCFGSNANITENRPWVGQFASELQEFIFDKHVPFFGICFAHQLLGHMFGNKVDFLKKRSSVKYSKHRGYRKASVVHPKLRLMLSKLNSGDFYSENKLDLEFRNAYLTSMNWDAKRWQDMMKLPEWKLTTSEMRVRTFLNEHTSDHFIAHARHEQEVHDVIPGKLELAASSEECGVDALVHSECPILSVQPHPETPHDLRLGETLLRNFIYAADISYSASR